MTIAVTRRRWCGRLGRVGLALALLPACGLPCALAAAAPAMPSGPPHVLPGNGSLLARLQAVQEMDMRVKPAETRAAIDALLAEAARAKRPPLADVFLARNSRAATFAYSGDQARALQEMDALVADIAKSPLAGGVVEAEVEGNRAALLAMMGRQDEAEAVFNKLAPFWDRTRGPGSEDALAVRSELAVLRYRKGDAIGAEQGLREVVRIARATPEFPSHVLVMYWQNWATILNGLGRTAEAINELQDVSRFAERHLGTGHAVALAALRNLGNALNSAGRFAEAEAVLRRVLDLTAKVEGETSPALAVTYNNLGNALNMLRGPEAALPMYRAAYDLARTHPDPSAPTSMHEFMLNVAVAESNVGNDEEAIRLRRLAVQEAEAVAGASHPVFARANAELGANLVDVGKVAEALPYLEVADAIFAKVLPETHNQRLDNAMLLAIARQRSGDRDAYAQARDTARIATRALLDQVTSPTQTLKTARRNAVMFTRYAALALQAGQPEDAFAAIQLAQLGDLDTAGAALMTRQASADPGLAETLRQLQDKGNQLAALRQARSRQVADAQLDAVAALDQQLADATAAMEALRAQVDAAFPAYAKLVRPEPQSLAAVQARLGEDDALLLAVPAPRGLLSMLVTRDQYAYADTPLAMGRLPALVMRVRNSVDDALVAADPALATFDAGAASALHSALLPPALDRIARRHHNLRVMAGGALASVPVGLLITRDVPDDARLAGDALRRQPWLVRRQAVSVPASLRLLGQGERRMASREFRFAGIGAPALAKADTRLALNERVSNVLRGGSIDADSLRSLPELPDAGAELARMQAAFGKDALLVTGASATEAKVRKLDLIPYNVIAFATHGLVSGELRGVSEPGLVLTPVADDPGNDGLLTASDVAELRLDADWVILSACNTAAGENPGAPLYSGLARAFVHAGARGLLLSHWAVRDDVAARLSVDTVQANRNGAARAQALRQAQLRVIDDRRVAGGAHPAVWAPFALVGD